MPPRKGRRPKPTSSSRFLFVNEDAGTVTRLSKNLELDREKQSHVQRQNFAKRRLEEDIAQAPLHNVVEEVGIDTEGDVRSRAAVLADRFPILVTEDEASVATLPEAVPATSRQSGHETLPYDAGLTIRIAPAPDPQSLPQFEPVGPSAPGLTKAARRHLIHSTAQNALFNPLRSITPHPLFAEPGPASILSQWAPVLMQYWTTVLIRESFFIDTRKLPLSRLRHAPAIHAEMRDAMSHPAHLYSLLAAASIQMFAREGRLLPSTSDPLSDIDHMRIVLFFKTRAIESLRAALASGPVTHTTVSDVLRLMTVAFFSDTPASAIPHHEALMSMMDQLGGLSTFSDYFIETRVTLHWAASLRSLSVPTMATTPWDPGAGHEEIQFINSLLRRTSSRHHTRGFASLVAAGVLAPGLHVLANKLADVLRFERYAEAHAQQTVQTPLASKPEHFKWANQRHVALGFHLLSWSPSDTDSDADMANSYDSRNEAIRIALIYTVGLTRSPGRGRRCGSKSVHKLRTVLESEPARLAERWFPHAEALLWVAVVGALTATRATVEWAWFVALARACTGEVGVRDVTDLERVLGEFLWESEVLDQGWGEVLRAIL